ncbi:hypothetical protein AX16_003931 [Volvariella volvacea WC 439]|nr:hypothetical protein AX16_003931 [Volvariella volvacea WC 439]
MVSTNTTSTSSSTRRRDAYKASRQNIPSLLNNPGKSTIETQNLHIDNFIMIPNDGPPSSRALQRLREIQGKRQHRAPSSYPSRRHRRAKSHRNTAGHRTKFETEEDLEKELLLGDVLNGMGILVAAPVAFVTGTFYLAGMALSGAGSAALSGLGTVLDFGRVEQTK